MFGNPETTPGRPRAQVLLVGAPRHPPHRDAQGGRRGDRQPRARQGGEEQGRAAVQAGRVRHHLRRRASPGRARCSTSGSSGRSCQKSGSYFSFGDERLGQGRQNATAFLREHPDVVQQILARIQAEAPAGAGRLRAAAADARQPPEDAAVVERGRGGGRGGRPPSEAWTAWQPRADERAVETRRSRALRSPRPARARRSSTRAARATRGRRRRPSGERALDDARAGRATSTTTRFARARARARSPTRGSGDALDPRRPRRRRASTPDARRATALARARARARARASGSSSARGRERQDRALPGARRASRDDVARARSLRRTERAASRMSRASIRRFSCTDATFRIREPRPSR